MEFKIPITNRGYAAALQQIGEILEKVMANKEVEEIFHHYAEVVNSDEAAAILTLAEVMKGSEESGAAEEEPKTKRQRSVRQQTET